MYGTKHVLAELLGMGSRQLTQSPAVVLRCMRKGFAEYQIFKVKKADPYMKKALELAHNDEKDVVREMEYAGRGIALAYTREYGGAITNLEKALEINPGSGIVHFFLGCALDDNYESALSVDHLEKAIECDFRNPEVYLRLAHSLNNCGRPVDAIRCLKPMLKQYPDYANGHYEMATAYMSMKKIELVKPAIRCYKRAIRADPYHKKAHEYLGIAYMAIYEDKIARKYLMRALKLAPGDPDVLEMLALLGDTDRQSGYVS